MKRLQAGVSLIEIMVGLAIVAFLLLLGVPEFATFMQNTQIRNAAETTLAGLTLARAEAVRRNAPVRFQLVSNLTSGCITGAGALNDETYLSWVVSVEDPTGLCNIDPSDTVSPMIVQKKSGLEGSANVRVDTNLAPVVTFTGLGRTTGAAQLRLDFFSAPPAVCEHNGGNRRCLAILVTTGGAVKMCDPKVGDATDPRHCS